MIVGKPGDATAPVLKDSLSSPTGFVSPAKCGSSWTTRWLKPEVRGLPFLESQQIKGLHCMWPFTVRRMMAILQSSPPFPTPPCIYVVCRVWGNKHDWAPSVCKMKNWELSHTQSHSTLLPRGLAITFFILQVKNWDRQLKWICRGHFNSRKFESKTRILSATLQNTLTLACSE